MRGSRLRRDVERTKAAGFLDRRSHFTIATHKGPAQQFMFGKDMMTQRIKAYVRDGGRCQNKQCRKWCEFDQFELDHIIPRSKGGDDSLGNLQVLCQSLSGGCHRGKGAKHG